MANAQAALAAGDAPHAYKILRKLAGRNAAGDILMLGAVAAFQCGKTNEALKHLATYLSRWPEDAHALFNMGHILLHDGRAADALKPLLQLVEVRPDHPHAQANLSAALYQCGRLQEAASASEEALKRAHSGVARAEILNQLGNIRRAQERNSDAEDAFRSALTEDPESAEAVANLAMLLEELSRIDEATNLCRDALVRFPDDPRLHLAAARCERRNGDPDSSVRRLAEVNVTDLPAPLESAIHFELGRSWDGLGEFEHAFNSIKRANEITSKALVGDVERSYFPKIAQRAFEYYRDKAAPATRLRDDNGLPKPVFLIGFPRSGTTLLELSLDAHTDAAVMEEPTLLNDLYRTLTKDGAPYPDMLADLDESKLTELRETYYRQASSLVDLTGKRVLINKHPLDTVFLPIILSVFPDAKIIFSMRHPADVCLSCYFQEFRMNNANVHFLNMDSTVDLYSRVMDLKILMAERAELDSTTVTYEDFVMSPETTTANVLDFLGLDKAGLVTDHMGAAKARQRVKTASYHQVAEPIYTRSRYRWENYRRQLAPVLPRLERFIKQFGY